MNEIDNLQIANARSIYEASHNNDLVVFVGAGVSVNSGVPDWGQLINEFKRALPDSVQEEHDYLKVAQLYKEAVPPGDYINSIQTILKDGKTHPNPIHSSILRLAPSHIITTNYDNLMEQAAENSRIYFSIIRSDKDVPFAKSSRYLIKMHGDFASKNIVLTESDYYNYAVNYPLIDTLVKSLFASKTILCIGFSFNDLNLKIILNRIQSMLGNNAKPIYLLADYNENPVFYNYLKNKGIQPFWLPKRVVEQYGEDAPESLSNGIGREIFKQQSCLRHDVSKPLDLIDALNSYAQMVEGEMPFFYVSRLKKILPDKICKWDHTYSLGIQLESDYIQSLIEQCKTIEGKRRLLHEKGEKIHSLIHTAANNCIFEFDRIKLWQLKSFQRYWNSKERDCCSFFLDFDFRSLTKRIKKLELTDCTYSNRDLELPFIKWILGDIISSYNLYESLEQRFWNSSNSILYFLCTFNKQALFNGSFPLDSMPYETVMELSKKAGGIDLNRILSDLFIDSRVKENLSDLINNQYYVDTFSSINRLTNAILEDKYRSEHNGFSLNSNIAELSSKLTRSFDYSYVNYIITTNNGSAYESFRNGIIGLLNAHKIKGTNKAGGHLSTSRLEDIESGYVKLMLFTLDCKDLKRIFDIYNVDSIKFNSEAIIYIQTVIDNILRDRLLIVQSLRYDILINRLACLFIIYSKSSNDLNKAAEIIDILIEYGLLNYITLFDFQWVAYDIIRKNDYKFSESQCHRLLSFFPVVNQHRGVSSLFSLVSSRMKDSGWTIDHSIEIDKRDSTPSWQLLNEIYLYYDIVPDDIREKMVILLKDVIHLSNNDMQVLCALIVNKHAYAFITMDLIEKLNTLTGTEDKDHLRCLTLKEIFENCRCSNIKDRITEVIKSDARLTFYISPTSYEGEVDVQWLIHISDEDFRALMKREDIIQVMKHSNIESDLMKRFWRLY